MSVFWLAQETDAEPCPLVYRDYGTLDINALPEGIERKELFAGNHPDETIGTFSKFSVTDGSQTKSYTAGDYV